MHINDMIGGTITTVGINSRTGVVNYLVVKLPDGTSQSLVGVEGGLKWYNPVDVANMPFDEFLTDRYNQYKGHPDRIDRHLQACHALLVHSRTTDDEKKIIREHLDWVNRQ